MRPARWARRPASVPRRIARAIATGSSAREIAVAHSTASQPSSIASAASEAVPTPASRITGTPARSRISRRLYGFSRPWPEPIGEPGGHHRGAADVLQPAGEDRVVVRVREHGEAVVDELLGRLQQRGRVGQQRALVADHLELDPARLERLAGELRGEHRVARGEAAGGVRQQRDARAVEHVDDRAALGRVDAAQRDGDELGRARLDRRGEHVERAEAARAEQQPRAELAVADDAAGRSWHRSRSCSASLDRAQDLDPRPFLQLVRAPLPAGHDLGVDGDGHAAAGRRQLERLDGRLDRRAVGELGRRRR